jgi:FkbM family methyltransferase
MTLYKNYIKDATTHLHQGQFKNFIQTEWVAYLQRRQYRKFQKRIQRWKSFKEGNKGSILFSLEPGVQIYLFSDSELSRLIYLNRFEKSEQTFTKRFLTKGDIFVDVGANIGLFSLIASKVVGQSGHVYAFEPCTDTYDRFQKNIKLAHLKNISSFPIALSDEDRTLDLRVSKDGFDAWNSFVNPSIESVFETESVQTMRWDDFAHRHSLFGKVIMIKIDVEGWEMQVLEGMKNTLSRSDAPVLQVEFTEENCHSNGYACKDLYNALSNFGYRLFTYDVEENVLIPEPLREIYPHLNILAIKNLEAVVQRIK